jgi:hypothetical protein
MSEVLSFTSLLGKFALGRGKNLVAQNGLPSTIPHDAGSGVVMYILVAPRGALEALPVPSGVIRGVGGIELKTPGISLACGHISTTTLAEAPGVVPNIPSKFSR